jgi:galactoside O-acetyltransferase
MAYLSEEQLKGFGFKYIGKNVKVSDKASIYTPELMELGDHSRIDDFCVLSGNIVIGQYCHITPMCLVAGGLPGIVFSDFCTLAYGAKVFAQSDDYSGRTLANSLIPKKYKNEILEPVFLGKHVIVGAGSIILPGIDVAEGCSIGAMSLVNKSTQSWGVYVGSPVKRLKERNKGLLELEKQFLLEMTNDSL